MLRVSVAGRVGIDADGGRVDEPDLGGRRPRLALAYLVLAGRAVHREELAYAIWGDRPPASWEPALRVVIGRLRSALGRAGLEDMIRTAFGAYELVLPPGTSVDVREAERLVGVAESMLDADPHATLQAARDAASIASRPFLQGEEGEWISSRRAALAELRARSLETIAAASIATGARDAAVAAAREVIAQDPFRERSYALLIRAHAGDGDRAEALRTYERCRRLLAEELGTEPSADTQAAYLDVLASAAAPPRTVTLSERLPLPGSLLRAEDGLIGRADSLAALHLALESVSGGGSRIVTVSGEPGVGKSRLAREAARAAYTRGVAVLFGGCSAEALQPYEPFAEALHHYVSRRSGEQLVAEIGTATAELSLLVPAVARKVSVLGEHVPSDVERARLFDSVATALAAAATGRPLLLLVDDLQWADLPTLALLRYLARSPDVGRLLVIGTYRSTEVVPGHALAAFLSDARRDVALDEIELSGLAPDEVGRLIAATRRSPCSPVVADAVHHGTRGNPLFVCELARDLSESDADEIERLRPLGVPRGVRTVVEQRVGRLSEACRLALSLASVLGQDFPVTVLAQLVGWREAATIDALDEAVRASILIEGNDRDDVYSFAHALVRQSLYDAMTRARRARAHKRAADVLKATPGVAAAGLAHHCSMAGELTDALRYEILAGDQAKAAAAHEDAVVHYERAIGLLPAHDLPGKCDLLTALAQVSWLLPDAVAARDLGRRAGDIAVQLGDPVRFAEASIAAVGGEQRVDMNLIGVVDRESVGILETALAAVPPSHPGLRVRVTSALSRELYFERSTRRSETLAADALALARTTDDPAALARALTARHLALYEPGHAEERLELAGELLGIAEATGQPSLEMYARYYRQNDLLELERLDELDRENELLFALADERRSAMFRVQARQMRGARAVMEGRFDDGIRLAEEVAEHGRAGEFDAEMGRAALHAQVAMFTGDTGPIIPVIESFAVQSGVAAWTTALVPAYLHADRPEDARAAVESIAADGFAALREVWEWRAGMFYVSEAVGELEEAGWAHAVYETLLPCAPYSVVVADGALTWGAAPHALGICAAVLGDWERAAEHFEDALARNRRMGARPLLARTAHEYARALSRRGRRADRRRMVSLRDEAAAIADDIGLVRLRRQLAALT